jgi:hypothetical protein
MMVEKLSANDGEIPIPLGVYPLNWESNSPPPNQNNVTNTFNNNTLVTDIYPDFKAWKQSEEEDMIMKTHLQKGYMEPQYVKHEDQSGRQFISDLINRSNSQNSMTLQQRDAKLSTMGKLFVDAMHKRKLFNGIKSKGIYKPPPRVTLTEHKKETWLKKLANANIPLQELSRAIPHGLRNKVLLEQCLNHQIPISRAIWLIKCISTNEQRQLKRKNNPISISNVNSNSSSVNKWIIEWTEQITSFFESIIENCFNPNISKDIWKFRLNYTIELIVNLYSADLMNRITFLIWIVRYISHIVNISNTLIDLKPMLVYQYIIKLFWFKIIKFDYLTKELSESMLLFLAKSNQFSKGTRFDSLFQKVTGCFQYLIKYLFYYNSDIFILPSNWNYLKPYLKKVLDMNLPLVGDQFKLITYRNESLTIDEFDFTYYDTNDSSVQNIIPHDKISLILYKLNNLENESISALSKLIFEESNSNSNSNWKNNLDFVFQWCIQKLPDNKVNIQRISLVCSLLQFKVNQLLQIKSKKYKQIRTDLEMQIIDFVYMMSEILNYKNKKTIKGDFYDVNSFLIFINKLFSFKLFIVSAYLRRLIASGVIYLSEPDRSCYIHILILNSLRALNDPNLKSILKRLVDSTGFQITEINTTSFERSNKDLIEIILTQDDVDLQFTENQFQSNLHSFNNDPIQVGYYMNADEFLFSEFNEKLKERQTELILTYNKLLILYELFEHHSDGLCKFLVLILDSLNKEDPTIQIFNDRTFCLFLKILFVNLSLLKSSIYNLKSSTWNHCTIILSSWIETNKYNISELLKISNISAAQLSNFEQLERVLHSVPIDVSFLSPMELSTLDVSSYERLSNGAEFVHYATLAVTKYSNFIRRGDESVDSKLIVKFLKSLQYWKSVEFSSFITDYLIRFLKPTLQLDYESNLKLLMSLIIDEFINFKTVIDIFQNKNTSSDLFETNDNNIILFWDLFFNPKNEFTFNDHLLYNFSKAVYILDYAADYYKILSQVIYSSFSKKHQIQQNDQQMVNVPSNSGPVGVTPVEVAVNVNSPVSVDVIGTFHDLNDVSHLKSTKTENDFLCDENDVNLLNDMVINSFSELVSHHLNLFIEYFYLPYHFNTNTDFSKLKQFVFYKVLNINADKIIDEIQIFENLNYFNLPILQWLFTYIITEKYENIVPTDIKSAFIELIENLSRVIQKDDKNYKLAGELFVYLPESFKHTILATCEDLYLNSELFPKVSLDGANVTNLLSCIMSSCSRIKVNASTSDGDLNNQKINNSNKSNNQKNGNVTIKDNSNHILTSTSPMSYTNSLLQSDGISGDSPNAGITNNSYNSNLIDVGKSNEVIDNKDSETKNAPGENSLTLEKKHTNFNLEMSDATVFSLNAALEKLIHICNHLEHQKKRTGKVFHISDDLELGVKMISRIILLHRYFLVELILKRSISLQRDVLIINLLKLFNHKIMIKDPKLKNLLYDVLISIKVIISESITEQFQRNQSTAAINNNNNTSTNSPNILINKNTPTGAFFSPVNSPKPTSYTSIVHNVSMTGLNSNNNNNNNSNDILLGEDTNINSNHPKTSKNKMNPIKKPSILNNNMKFGGMNNNNNNNNINNSYIIMPNILNIKPPSFNNNLKNLLSMFDLKDTIPEHENKLYVVNQHWDGKIYDDQNLIKFTNKPFELIEDSCPKYATNDCAIGLQMFNMSVKRENPK